MERREIEQVERELDEILRIVQPPFEDSQALTEEEDLKAHREEGSGEKVIQEGDGREGSDKAIGGLGREEAPLDEEGEPEEADGREPLWAWETGGLRILKPSDGMLAAFFVPIAVMLIIFAQRGIFPLGEECFLRTDMYHQYAPFFSEFQNKLTHGGSLLYTWDIGLGVNFSALYAYYLASPVNWLLFLCPQGLVIEFMTGLIVLKTALAGVSFTWYLRKHCRRTDFGSGLFGIFYALSGYMAAYSWNIMWLDCIVLFPVVLWGLERLVEERRGGVYCVALGLSILSNYYISIMTCMFMVIYVAARVIITPPRGLRNWFGVAWRFALYSLLAGGMAAAVFLPAVFALQATASGEFHFPDTLSSYFSIFDMIARHIGNVGTEIGLDHWPNIYCGVAVLMFFLLYIGSRKIRAREKAVYCGLLLMFYASFSTNMLNFIWHGFHYPNSLPCRQSFIYIALMLTLCYKAYASLDSAPLKHVILAFWAAGGFVILAEKLVDNPEQYHFSVFYAALLLLALYTGLLYLYKKGKWSLDAVLLGALAVVSIEAAVNMAVTSVPTTSRTAYVSDNEDARALVEGIEDEEFYRVEKEDQRTKNDGAWIHFPSASLFSSTANASLSEFYRYLGCESSTNAYSITGSTPLADSLFSVKYRLYPDQQPVSDLMEQAGRSGDLWLYRNLYTLPLGFMLPGDLEENWILDSGNPASVQNDLCTLLGTEQVLIANESITDGRNLTFTAEETGEYYVYVTNKRVESVSAVIGEKSLGFDNVERGYFLELGYILKGQEVRMEAENEGSPTLQAEVWRFNPQGLIEVHQEMSRQPMEIASFADTRLLGNVTAEERGTLFTTIPYDEGWTVLVDGSPARTRPVFDTFLGIDLEAGAHEIQFSYMPRGLKEGAIITAASLGILAALTVGGLLLRHKYTKMDNDSGGEER